MARVEIQHFKTKRNRNGKVRYYWMLEAADSVKFKMPAQRLADDKSEALLQAAALNKTLAEKRRGVVHGPAIGTVRWLILQYKSDEHYIALGAATKRDYDRHLTTIDTVFGDAPISEVTALFARQLYQKRKHKVRDSRYLVQVGRLLWNYGRGIDACHNNPWETIRTKGTAPDAEVWLFGEVMDFIDKAKAVGLPSIALGIALGGFTSQRKSDVVGMMWSVYDGQYIDMRQNKTGKRLMIPVYKLTWLKAMLDETPRTSLYMLVSESTRQPYKKGHYYVQYRRVAKAIGLRQGLKLKHLRNTALVWLFQAGCTLPEACAITGHSIAHGQQILDVYFVRTKELADSAMDKMSLLFVKMYEAHSVRVRDAHRDVVELNQNTKEV